MRKLICIFSIWILLAACEKSQKCPETVLITQEGTPCHAWGIKVGSNIYPVDTIPANFQQDNIPACVEYELYQDARACVCCGGTWARIIAISALED
jgi:hypothetical protein